MGGAPSDQDTPAMTGALRAMSPSLETQVHLRYFQNVGRDVSSFQQHPCSGC